MNQIEPVLRILIIISLSLSSMLLGMSQGTLEPLFVSLIAAAAAWLLVDTLRWFRLPQWLANLIAVLVTVYTIAAFFFTGDPIQQLLGVGNLLIYLQSILLFQQKSSRVYWQILVLGLLQVVVGAVFNLGFEGGILFVVYLFFAGVTMLVLHTFQQFESVSDRISRVPSARRKTVSILVTTAANGSPSGRFLSRMVRHYLLMGCGTLAFGIALFYFLPRSNSTWAGLREEPMTPAGSSVKVSLAHPSVIPQSTQLVMSLKFRRLNEDEYVIPGELPYLRGMALANIIYEDGATAWTPAINRVGVNDFRTLGLAQANPQGSLMQEIVLEPTQDPLLFSVFPPLGLTTDNEDTIEFCWPTACFTRERTDKKIKVTQYRYTFVVPVRPGNLFYEAWPYRPLAQNGPLTREADEGNWQWLTKLDRNRYPSMMRAADEVLGRAGNGDTVALCRAMVQRLSESNGFSYTTDFRDVERNTSLDPVEDFFANHRTGHCSYYASALALMLRSAGIPARVVSGYRGGSKNEFGEHFDVEVRHAHAWVEAYIPPEDCPREWTESGAAGRYGAWMQLDATPPIDPDAALGGDALNFARSFWRDYVNGLQAETGANTVEVDGVRFSGLFRILNIGWWQDQIIRLRTNSLRAGTWERQVRMYGPWGAGVLVLAILAWKRRTILRWLTGSWGPEGQRPVSGWRARAGNWLSSTLEGIAPGIARWLRNESARDHQVAFYRDFETLVGRRGWTRNTGETPMEFADSMGAGLPQESSSALGEIRNLARSVTGNYYRVRFGQQTPEPAQLAEIESDLARMAALLEESALRPGQPDPSREKD